MVGATTLTAELGRIEKDTSFNRSLKYKGYAQYMRSGSGANAVNLARLMMWPDGKTEADFKDQFICTGAFIYRFMPDTKEIHAYEIPKPKAGDPAPDNVLAFVFGMKVEDAKKHYEMTLTREDEWYYYVGVKPRTREDRADFVQAEIVLSKKTFLPRQLWFKSANESETTWDIPRIDAKSPIKREVFDAPRTPAGWKLVPVKAGPDARPTVIRP
jgi:TIGR03009 family protein